VDKGDGVACKGRCEIEVAAIASLVTKNTQVTQNAGGAITIQFIMFLLVGVAATGAGVYGALVRDWGMVAASFFVGPMVLALAYGQYQWLAGKTKKVDKAADQT
jgi:hypothetical protein